MNQEKFGMLIKEIRKKYNLTQKELADKYHVTYQAVSKWENGQNMPDTSLLKQISQDFNISLEDLLEGVIKEKETKKKNILIILTIILSLLTILVIIYLLNKGNDFQFKTLSANCDDFNISGNISYNDKKSAIYITNIQYCGGDDTEEYQKIDCILYETDNDIEKKISSYSYDKKESIKLEDFLQQVTLTVDNYTQTCKEYKDNSLYLAINATNKDNKITTYKIPLILDETCSVK